MGERGWSPLVYARTPERDDWWRAVPRLGPGTGVPAWLATAVHAVVQGGRDLRYGPRFVMAHSGGQRLVGVACRATELSTTMRSDGVRELYGFVGWLGEDQPPELPDLQANYSTWAGAEYERWLRPVWNRPWADAAAVQPTGPAPGPWSRPSAVPEVEPIGIGATDTVEVWPENEADLLWRAATACSDPVVVVTGLRVARPTRLRGLTHAASADVDERRRVLLVPQASSAMPASATPDEDVRTDAAVAPQGWRSAVSRAVAWLRRASGC